jgi:hypothetical protein
VTSLLSIAAERVQAFFLEPAPRPPDRKMAAAHSAPLAVAVIGLGRRSGVTTVASAVAAVLRLPRPLELDPGALAEPAASGEPGVVWAVHEGDLAGVEPVATRADAIVLVAAARGEPALAEIVCRSLASRFNRVLLVANRGDSAGWEERAAVCFPEAPLGARIARGGRVPPGAFGAAARRLAGLVAAG